MQFDNLSYELRNMVMFAQWGKLYLVLLSCYVILAP
jgi:hypothetical protein